MKIRCSATRWWKESTLGVKRHAELPVNARSYLRRIEEVTETSIDIISTGPDRADTIVLEDPCNGQGFADKTASRTVWASEA
jgi:adenylosuccinate synthase